MVMKFLKWFCLLLIVGSIEADEWKRVYLASAPRSGNHWLRYLIEEATHIATSSVYRDKNDGNLPTLFEWGGYCCDHGHTGNCRYPGIDDPIVIKTHYPALKNSPFDLQSAQMTIRIVRHPIDVFYSWKIAYGDKTLPYFISKWKKFQEYWNAQDNILTIRYEDLLARPFPILKQVLEAIGCSVSNRDIERAIATYPPSGEPLKHLSRYTEEELNLIASELSDLLIQFGY